MPAGPVFVVPGAFTSGTNHVAHAGAPADRKRDAAYDPDYGTTRADLDERLATNAPPGADVQTVAPTHPKNE